MFSKNSPPDCFRINLSNRNDLLITLAINLELKEIIIIKNAHIPHQPSRTNFIAVFPPPPHPTLTLNRKYSIHPGAISHSFPSGDGTVIYNWRHNDNYGAPEQAEITHLPVSFFSHEHQRH